MSPPLSASRASEMCLPQTSHGGHGHQRPKGDAQQDVELRLVFQADLPALLVQPPAADALLLLHRLKIEEKSRKNRGNMMQNRRKEDVRRLRSALKQRFRGQKQAPAPATRLGAMRRISRTRPPRSRRWRHRPPRPPERLSKATRRGSRGLHAT